jgi:hypothetical protein
MLDAVLLGLLLLVGGRHDPGLRADPLTLRNTKLEEFGDRHGKAVCAFYKQTVPGQSVCSHYLLLKEQCFVSRIRHGVLLKHFILYERVIRPVAKVGSQSAIGRCPPG